MSLLKMGGRQDLIMLSFFFAAFAHLRGLGVRKSAYGVGWPGPKSFACWHCQ
jgi:hypothetical protein